MKNPESHPSGEPPVGRLRRIMDAIAAKLGYAPAVATPPEVLEILQRRAAERNEPPTLEDWAPSNEEDPVVVIPVTTVVNSDPMSPATINVHAEPFNTEQVPAAPKVSEITQNKGTVQPEILELRRKKEALKTIETQLT